MYNGTDWKYKFVFLFYCLINRHINKLQLSLARKEASTTTEKDCRCSSDMYGGLGQEARLWAENVMSKMLQHSLEVKVG